MSERGWESRFWSYVERGSEIECWGWLGSHTYQGYGQFSIAKRNTARSHRVAYELLRGPIAAGLVIDHLCRNRGCCNPSHLEPVSNRENVLRGIGTSATNARRTHCTHGHEFTTENTRITPRGRRDCRKCECLRGQRRRAAQAAAQEIA